jgi:hypothetical protein
VRTGSGYVGKHTPDFVNFNDRWSQIINLRYDQDGSVYLIDWYDKQQCHNQRDPQVHDRSNGRIFKIVYNDQKVTKVDLAARANDELITALISPNAFHARHAARLLGERKAAGLLSNESQTLLQRLLTLGNHDQVKLSLGDAKPAAQSFDLAAQARLASDVVKLKLTWAIHSTGGLSTSSAFELLGNSGDYIRSWTIQLLCEDKNPSDAVLKEFARMAKEDSSPMVRLYLASAMQRTSVEKRMPVLEALVAHAEDANDHNLPLMYWYAAEPVVGASTQNAVKLLGATKIPKVREFITRRMTAKPVAQSAP